MAKNWSHHLIGNLVVGHSGTIGTIAGDDQRKSRNLYFRVTDLWMSLQWMPLERMSQQ